MKEPKPFTRNLPNREILTRGPLFEAVQAFRIFPDSKTFPDLIPKFRLDPDEVRVGEVRRDTNDKFEEHMAEFNSELGDYLADVSGSLREFATHKSAVHLGLSLIKFKSALDTFLKNHFYTPSVEPTREKAISRGPICTMEAYIDNVWDVLTRDKNTLPAETLNSTLYPLPYTYVVAGGRFNEIYYWDGYFTGEGLVRSGKLDLFECMVKNYAWFIKGAGFVPNGNRTYYSSRSQPPFYCFMLDILVREKGLTAVSAFDDAYYFRMLEEEYKFWMTKPRVVNVDDHTMNLYWDEGVSPRPEAYHEDTEASTRANFLNNDEQESNKEIDEDKTEDRKRKERKRIDDFFRNIRAAAESGWDFSSRWFRATQNEWGRTTRDITTIRTTNIIPVDLNSLLYFMERRLYDWRGKDEHKNNAIRRKKAILELCWDDQLGWFFDYNFEKGSRDYGRTDVWSLAGAYPLFCRLFDDNDENDKKIVERMARALKERFLKPGGVVTTLFETGAQWDYPNGWAPLQWIVVRGLLNYDEHDLAWTIASRFTECVGKEYNQHGRIMEKYNVCNTERMGGGGEYEVQHGFGWTNGVIKGFMTEFRNRMEKDPKLAGYLGGSSMPTTA